ncbi:putative SRSF protein kinase 1-like isoform X2 [Capsicum annuum]|uniref:non-specific serine/threonine protein kinase n=1 Tax=Capsicum annuum TaxID=4072 RepID=A0A2G2ZNH1_CAPAN|nr:putative SRSF protein kinase 1-like isoform X2 [Capsicum annuum]KAF3637227.1 putative SRSF protein kinase 1-like isoform X2 [Capsicum annuum]PHT83537.1 hypothetical protein T459_11980 [Capsicum annuum]
MSFKSSIGNYLLRDVYDDMMLDGVKPGRDTFHSLLICTMKGARLQDAFFSCDQSMVFIPDIAECDLDDKKSVANLLDNFKHSGPNEQHVCIVFEYLDDNLLTLLNYTDYRGLPIHMVKEQCFYVLVGLDYMHRQLSIIHTDLKPENVLLCSIIDPSKDPRKSRKPLILPNHKDKTTLDGGAPKGYVASDENLIKNYHKKIRRKAKQAAQCFVRNDASLMTKAGQHTSTSTKLLNGPLDTSIQNFVYSGIWLAALPTLQIIELVEKSNGWSAVEALSDIPNMPPKMTNRRRTRNQLAPPPIQAYPLDEHLSHTEFGTNFTSLDHSIPAQKECPTVVYANPVANTVAARIRDFTRMSPPLFLGSKSEEDP